MKRLVLHYLVGLSMGLNQLINATTGGSPTETVSARAAIAREHGSHLGAEVCRVLGAIDFHHEVQGEDHCDKALRHLHERAKRVR